MNDIYYYNKIPPCVNSLPTYMVVLQREIAMAWGTTTDRLTPEINLSLYARETKHITLKDLNSYLILNG